MYSRIAGTGKYLPERVLTNADLEKMVETTDEWIKSRTGIERRHIAADDEYTSHLAHKAALAALESAGVTPNDIDFVVVGTTTPDLIFPNVACLVQDKLGPGGHRYSLGLSAKSITAAALTGPCGPLRPRGCGRSSWR